MFIVFFILMTRLPPRSTRTKTICPDTTLVRSIDGQTQGVESVLGISTAVSQALDEDGLTQLFEPYAPIELDLDLPVLDTDAAGATEELFAAGPAVLTADRKSTRLNSSH